MKFGVVVFPGSNCDQDIIHVLQNVLKCEVKILWHKDKSLGGLSSEDCVILPGGFSFGDYLRSGALARFSPIMESVISFAQAGGKVLGICNGFQILCEAHLLPGALAQNLSEKFTCKNVYLQPATTAALLTRFLDKSKAYKVPIAHAEGRYICSEATYRSLVENDQILFRYCDENGTVSAAANPNGALDNIAGICNAGRNVFGMMPHPERAAESVLGNTDGLAIFRSLLGIQPASASF